MSHSLTLFLSPFLSVSLPRQIYLVPEGYSSTICSRCNGVLSRVFNGKRGRRNAGNLCFCPACFTSSRRYIIGEEGEREREEERREREKIFVSAFSSFFHSFIHPLLFFTIIFRSDVRGISKDVLACEVCHFVWGSFLKLLVPTLG